MPDSIPNSWEPDPRQVGKNWRDLFRDPQRDGQPPGDSATPPTARDESPDEVGGAVDLMEYKPWIVQRVRSHPALMLELRRYEPRSGLWSGWIMPYHSMFGLDFTGDRLMSLDFGGTRQFVIEGRSLDVLARHIQSGIVTAIVEYQATVWPQRSSDGVVTAIRRVSETGAH